MKCLSSNASASWCCTLLSDLLAADTTSALRWPNASSRCAIMHGVPRFPIATTELRSLGSGFPALPVCQKGQFLCHCRSNRDSDYLCNHQCRAQELLRVEVLVLTWIRRYSIVSFPQRNLSSRSAWPHSSRNSALPANHDMRYEKDRRSWVLCSSRLSFFCDENVAEARVYTTSRITYCTSIAIVHLPKSVHASLLEIPLVP